MPKGHILDDAFEQLVELGQTTAKKSVKQVAQTVNPLKIVPAILGQENTNESNKTHKSHSPESAKKDKDHTPLDFKKLNEKYKDKEKTKMEGLRNRLFQIVKREDEKSLEREKMQSAEKKRKEEYLVQEKKRKEQEKKRQEQQNDIPRGKVKRSIFSSKKSADRQHAELKPASGKQ
jgi:hypothetical protein